MKTGRRRKLNFSKLYSFRCGRASFSKDDHSEIGGPGFSRVVYCNEPGVFEAAIRHYAANSIRSTKYTATSFFPKALFEQFRRVANFYFLVTGSLAFTPLAPYTAVSAILPLFVVIGATMIKEGIEDWRRKQQVFPSLLALHKHVFLFIFFNLPFSCCTTGDCRTGGLILSWNKLYIVFLFLFCTLMKNLTLEFIWNYLLWLVVRSGWTMLQWHRQVYCLR